MQTCQITSDFKVVADVDSSTCYLALDHRRTLEEAKHDCSQMNGTLADGRNLDIFKKFTNLNWRQFWISGEEQVESVWKWGNNKKATDINLEIKQTANCAALMNENSQPLLISEQCRHKRYGAVCGISSDGKCDEKNGFQILSTNPCIRFKDNKYSWFDAREACYSIKSDLLNFVYKDIIFPPKSDGVWLGLRRSRWILGNNELKENFWGDGEPSDSGTCLTVIKEFGNYVWKSEQCSAVHRFFCQIAEENYVDVNFSKEKAKPSKKPISTSTMKTSTIRSTKPGSVNDKNKESSGSNGKNLTIGLIVLCLILLLVFIVIVVLFTAYRRRTNLARKKSRSKAFAVARRCQDPSKMFTTVTASEEAPKSIPDVVSTHTTHTRTSDLYAKFKQQMKELTPRCDEDQTPFTSMEVAPDVRDEPIAKEEKVKTENETRSRRHHHHHKHSHRSHRHKREESEKGEEQESSDHRRHRQRRRHRRRDEDEEPVRRSRSLSSRRKKPEENEPKPKIRTRSNSWVGNMAPPVPPRDNVVPKVYDDVVILDDNTKSDIEI
ncbi:DgyrCDS8721 [Dimorphilus gyrociliatus]|uniref:DgyrCDS8721 n=1 Tax=Dimorphilus gyrociliatus TaxID=2664684 RepID=A0A7I8VV29_9ANNE|nr:DgyrCDS8721 [Dimorphilus gyrociliatus]